MAAEKETLETALKSIPELLAKRQLALDEREKELEGQRKQLKLEKEQMGVDFKTKRCYSPQRWRGYDAGGTAQTLTRLRASPYCFCRRRLRPLRLLRPSSSTALAPRLLPPPQRLLMIVHGLFVAQALGGTGHRDGRQQLGMTQRDLQHALFVDSAAQIVERLPASA